MQLEFLGYIWIPALLAGYLVVYRNPPKSFNDMAKYAVVLLLIFFLSRSWLSEQNINLLFPFLLIMLASGKVSSRNFHLVWIVSLVFLVLNMSIPQLFFLAYPPIISARDAFDVQFGAARLVARFSVTVLWWIVAFGILTKLLNQKTIIQQTSAKLNSAFN